MLSRTSTSQNFLLADKSGHMAVVEACAEKVRVREPQPDQDFIVATNNFLHPEMLTMEKEHDRNWFHSETRYKTMCETLRRHNGKINSSIAQKLLSGFYGFVCQYDPKENIDTLWSMTATLTGPVIARAEGNPGKVHFNVDTRLRQELAKKKRHSQ